MGKLPGKPVTPHISKELHEQTYSLTHTFSLSLSFYNTVYNFYIPSPSRNLLHTTAADNSSGIYSHLLSLRHEQIKRHFPPPILSLSHPI